MINKLKLVWERQEALISVLTQVPAAQWSYSNTLFTGSCEDQLPVNSVTNVAFPHTEMTFFPSKQMDLRVVVNVQTCRGLDSKDKCKTSTDLRGAQPNTRAGTVRSRSSSRFAFAEPVTE